MDAIAAHEHALLVCNRSGAIHARVRIIGTAGQKAAVLSFAVNGVHPHDIGTLLNQEGIAVRTGHHCAQPVMQRFKVPATSRASFAFYNTLDEVDALVAGIRNVQKNIYIMADYKSLYQEVIWITTRSRENYGTIECLAIMRLDIIPVW